MRSKTEAYLENSSTIVLKTYFSKYLAEVRGLSKSSVNHYLDALNHISRRLKAKGLIDNDIYEVMEYKHLLELKEILESDTDYVETNKRGNHMYSAGLNHYLTFAKGFQVEEPSEQVLLFDCPLPAASSKPQNQVLWNRDSIIKKQALILAEYSCEIDKQHKTFLSESTKKPYMEAHHAIPMRYQPEFDNSLDVFANLVCLCPICHRKIHYGLLSERAEMMDYLYAMRGERLANCGIYLGKEEFSRYASGQAVSNISSQKKIKNIKVSLAKD